MRTRTENLQHRIIKMPNDNTARIFTIPDDQQQSEPIIDITDNIQQCATLQPAIAINLNKLINNKDKTLLQNMCKEAEQIKRDIFSFIAKKKINDKSKVLSSITSNSYIMLTETQIATIASQAFEYADTHSLARFELYSTIPMLTIKKESIEVFANSFTIKTKYKDIEVKIPKYSMEIVQDALKEIIYASLICGSETVTLTVSCRKQRTRNRNTNKQQSFKFNKFKYKS